METNAISASIAAVKAAAEKMGILPERVTLTPCSDDSYAILDGSGHYVVHRIERTQKDTALAITAALNARDDIRVVVKRCEVYREVLTQALLIIDAQNKADEQEYGCADSTSFGVAQKIRAALQEN